MSRAIDSSGARFDYNGATYVALAPIVRQMGGDIEWDNLAKTAHVTVAGRTAQIQMANEEVVVDGRRFRLENPPLVVEDTLIVPHAFFADALNQPV